MASRPRPWARTGTSAGDFLTNTAAQTITGTLSGALADSDILYGSVDNGSTWIDITGKVNGTAISWDGVTLSDSGTILFKITDATGDDSTTTGSQTYVLDTTAPAFTSAATANFAENGTGTAYNATADGDSGVAYTLGGTDAAKFGINAGTGAVTFVISPDHENPTDSGCNNVYNITVTATDAAGNATDRAVAITVTDEDEVAPAFTSATTASFAENGTGTAYDATADSDSGITYTLGGTDVAKFGIVANTGVVTFTTSPNYEAPTDNGGNNVYNITVTATDAAGNATNQAVAITVTNVTNGTEVHANTNGTTGDFNDVIDLGAYGKLIAPVYVDGNWYYYWDRSGDGTSANSGGLNGGLDGTTHDVLDGLFANDINGVANTTVTNTDGLYGTTDIYRYATLNGVRVALPTHGEASVTAGNRPGTAIDNSPAGEANPHLQRPAGDLGRLQRHGYGHGRQRHAAGLAAQHLLLSHALAVRARQL